MLELTFKKQPEPIRIRFLRLAGWALAQIMISSFAFGQGLTVGPVVGGVTASDARVFVRTARVANVAVRYGTDPNLTTYSTSATSQTDPISDFTRIIPLASLAAETTYYVNVVINDVAQLAAPFPSFTTFPPSGNGKPVFSCHQTPRSTIRCKPWFWNVSCPS